MPTGQQKFFVHAKPQSVAQIFLDLRSAKNCRIEVEMERRAALQLWMVTNGSAQQSLAVRLSGKHSSAQIFWVAHAKQHEVQTIDARMTFEAPENSGTVQMRCLTEDHASLSARGTIVIGKKARGAEASLQLKSLILDATAHCTAVPALLVEQNDVKASHSAAISRMHPEDLFYLTSRGLSLKNARALVIQGFLDELLADIPSALRKHT